jgi:hypothetical protein
MSLTLIYGSVRNRCLPRASSIARLFENGVVAIDLVPEQTYAGKAGAQYAVSRLRRIAGGA